MENFSPRRSRCLRRHIFSTISLHRFSLSPFFSLPLYLSVSISVSFSCARENTEMKYASFTNGEWHTENKINIQSKIKRN